MNNLTFENTVWHIHADGERIPTDGYFRMTHSEWARVKALVDAAFEQVSEAEIVGDNHQKYLRSPLASPSERLKEDGTPYSQPPRGFGGQP